MNSFHIGIINVYYFLRLMKDKSLHSIYSYWQGNMKPVERIYEEPETVMNHITKLSVTMTPIVDNIILGNSVDASFYYRMEHYNIGTIINVTREIKNYFEGYFYYYNIEIYDQNHDTFTNEIFDNVCKFIDEQTKTVTDPSKRNILIHCYMGSSRSASVTAAYLIYKYGYSVDDCIKLLRSKRDIVNTNTTFRGNIENYYNYRMNLHNKNNDEDKDDTEYVVDNIVDDVVTVYDDVDVDEVDEKQL